MDLKSYLKKMMQTTDPISRIGLLSSVRNIGLDEFASNPKGLYLLKIWLNEEKTLPTALLCPLLKLILDLPVDLDILRDSQIGRFVKPFQKSENQSAQDLAVRIVEKWLALAKEPTELDIQVPVTSRAVIIVPKTRIPIADCDVTDFPLDSNQERKRKVSPEPTAPVKRQDTKITAIGVDLFRDKISLPSFKKGAPPIPVPASPSEPLLDLSILPVEQKIPSYRTERSSISDTPQSAQPGTPVEEFVSTPDGKKRVRFAPPPLLVQIRRFENTPEEIEYRKVNLRSEDSDSEGKAFHNRELDVEPDTFVEWRRPQPYPGALECYFGSKSTEKKTQEIREQHTVSFTFISNDHIPPPYEPDPQGSESMKPTIQVPLNRPSSGMVVNLAQLI